MVGGNFPAFKSIGQLSKKSLVIIRWKNSILSYLEPWLASLPDVIHGDFRPGVTDKSDIGWE